MVSAPRRHWPRLTTQGRVPAPAPPRPLSPTRPPTASGRRVPPQSPVFPSCASTGRRRRRGRQPRRSRDGGGVPLAAPVRRGTRRRRRAHGRRRPPRLWFRVQLRKRLPLHRQRLLAGPQGHDPPPPHCKFRTSSNPSIESAWPCVKTIQSMDASPHWRMEPASAGRAVLPISTTIEPPPARRSSAATLCRALCGEARRPPIARASVADPHTAHAAGAAGGRRAAARKHDRRGSAWRRPSPKK